MEVNLAALAKQAIDSELTAASARRLGEAPDATAAALRAWIPVLVGALVQRASSETGVRSLIAMLEAPEIAAAGSSRLQGQAITGEMQGLGRVHARSLLGGDKVALLAAEVATSNGVSPPSAAVLMALAATRVLATLKAQVRGFTEAELASLLEVQRPFVAVAIDSRLARILDFDVSGTKRVPAPGARAASKRVPERAAQARASAASHRATPARRSSKRSLFLGSSALIVALVLGSLFVLRDDTTSPGDAGITSVATTEGMSETRTSSAIRASEAAVARATRAIRALTLPDGTSLTVPAEGFIAALVDYLQQGASAGRAFVFDSLHFNMGSATLEPTSQPQLEQLATVLKAFDSAVVAIEAFTDSLGDIDANRALSQQRAESVRSALLLLGVDDARISATGYGGERPSSSRDGGPSDLPKRRVDLVVTLR